MELRTLKYFLAVARKGSITAAAEALFVTQPNLSRQLQELEEELGKTLFVRGKRRITLTPDGILLKQRAEEILMLVHRLKDEMLESEELVSGHLNLGTAECPAMGTVMEALRLLHKKQPVIQLHLFGGTAGAVMKQLDADELDFAVVVEPADLSRYDYRKLPGRNRWGLLMSRGLPLAALPAAAPDDLRDKPAVIPDQPLFKNQVAGWMGRHDRRLNVIATYNLSSDARRLAASGECYVLCMEGSVPFTEEDGLCFRPLSPEVVSDTFLIWKKYHEFTQPADCFFQALEAASCIR